MLLVNSLAEASQYLERFHDQARTKYTLDNMRTLMDFLENPQNKFKAVHVAGTSGKTSTSYYMAALLTASGQKTGLTVSPHIDQINERVQINGEPLPEAIFCKALSEFLELIERAPVRPSWFEIMVAFAYWYFACEQVDYAVIEVGLGGLKDGTNVITRPDKVCIITDIGYDHMNVLGSSLAEIAAQKAGIIQSRNEVFSYDQPDEIMSVLQNAANAQKAQLNVIKSSKNDQPLMPDYQFRNWSLAHVTYNFLAKRDGLKRLDHSKLQKTQQILVPGRMNVLHKHNRTLVLDGAHNQQKIEAMISSFKKLFPNQKPAVLISLKKGKEYEQVAPQIAKLSNRIIVTDFQLSQDVPLYSIDGSILQQAFEAVGAQDVKYIDDQAAAMDELLNGSESVCLVTGSLYLLGQLRSKGLV